MPNHSDKGKGKAKAEDDTKDWGVSSSQGIINLFSS
jgi:hypothetical protein